MSVARGGIRDGLKGETPVHNFRAGGTAIVLDRGTATSTAGIGERGDAAVGCNEDIGKLDVIGPFCAVIESAGGVAHVDSAGTRSKRVGVCIVGAVGGAEFGAIEIAVGRSG